MSNEVRFSITGDTNADQVAGKARAAVNGLDKQIDGIKAKFGSAFKDIFLSFLGPMALLGVAMAFIGKMIADNQRKQEEANKAAIDGTNKLMSEEDKYWARKQERNKQEKETKEQAKLTREEVTRQFLLSGDPRAAEMIGEEYKLRPIGEADRSYSMSRMKVYQDRVQAFIAEDAKKNPIKGELKDSDFKSPAGFSNVIGVGASPVLENLTRQTDIQQQILEQIKSMSPGSGGINQQDFTKEVPLPIQKAGL